MIIYSNAKVTEKKTYIDCTAVECVRRTQEQTQARRQTVLTKGEPLFQANIRGT